MKEEKTCCFTGHRSQKLGFGENSEQCSALKEKMRETIIDLIENHSFTYFISGMAIGTDIYAAQIILDLKNTYPNITLECARPCESQADKWNKRDRKIYYDTLAVCDTETLLQKPYTDDCMQKRNEYMVDHSDLILSVWNGTPSGTGKTIEYAQSLKIPVMVINPQSLELTIE